MHARRMRGLIALILGTLLSLSLAAGAIAHVMESPVSYSATRSNVPSIAMARPAVAMMKSPHRTPMPRIAII